MLEALFPQHRATPAPPALVQNALYRQSATTTPASAFRPETTAKIRIKMRVSLAGSLHRRRLVQHLSRAPKFSVLFVPEVGIGIGIGIGILGFLCHKRRSSW